MEKELPKFIRNSGTSHDIKNSSEKTRVHHTNQGKVAVRGGEIQNNKILIDLEGEHWVTVIWGYASILNLHQKEMELFPILRKPFNVYVGFKTIWESSNFLPLQKAPHRWHFFLHVHLFPFCLLWILLPPTASLPSANGWSYIKLYSWWTHRGNIKTTS